MRDVAAALIWENGRFLICQRPAHKARGLLWEFVGGKVEAGETPAQALVRECREELDIAVTPGPVFCKVLHEYPDISIRLILFNASIASGTPRLLEHNAMAWITPEEIDRYEFCPADEEILAMLRSLTPAHRTIREELFSLSDPGYQVFNASLLPTVDADTVLGVRMPDLRGLARRHREDAAAFCSLLPHGYYEENNLHALFLMQGTDFFEIVFQVECFLPYIDNWATCDLLKPPVFAKYKQELLPHIEHWFQSEHPYTVRFAVKMLMDFYLDDAFSPRFPQWVAAVSSGEYYVKMMQAWYFATALAKRYDEVLPYLTEGKLSSWVHQKTIQKAVESYRISPEQKIFLKTLRK